MIEVTYDGEYPSTCKGRLIIKEDRKEIYNKQFCCSSGGHVGLKGDPVEWNWVVECGELIWDEKDAAQFSVEIQESVKYVLSEKYVCCGGCI